MRMQLWLKSGFRYGLAFTLVCYLVFSCLLLPRLPVWLAGLLCGIICVGVILLDGIVPVAFLHNGYEIKNVLAFFTAGFALAIFAELVD